MLTSAPQEIRWATTDRWPFCVASKTAVDWSIPCVPGSHCWEIDYLQWYEECSCQQLIKCSSRYHMKGLQATTWFNINFTPNAQEILYYLQMTPFRSNMQRILLVLWTVKEVRLATFNSEHEHLCMWTAIWGYWLHSFTNLFELPSRRLSNYQCLLRGKDLHCFERRPGSQQDDEEAMMVQECLRSPCSEIPKSTNTHYKVRSGEGRTVSQLWSPPQQL